MVAPQLFGLISIVFMMGFVIVFDGMHWRRRYGWVSTNVISREESERILRILAASHDDSEQDQ